MKRTILNVSLILGLVLSLLPLATNAQTPLANGDLETWDSGLGYDNPTGWTSYDSWAAKETSPILTMKKDFLNPFEGLFCARMEAQNITFAGLFNKDVPGALLNADSIRRDPANALGPLLIHGWGDAWPESPEKLSGYYEYDPATGGDTLLFSIEFWTNDGSGRVMVGSGSWTSGDSVADYTRFEIPINYTSTVTPDSVGFIFSTSTNLDTPVVGSVMFLDSLTLTYGQLSDYAGSVADQLGLNINVFPNPVTNVMQLENPMEEVATMTIFSTEGREVYNDLMNPGINQFGIDQLAPGMYLYRIATDKLLVADGTFVIK